MIAKREPVLISLSLFLLGLYPWPLAAQTAKRIWVLREPGEIVEYDAQTFAARQTVKVPARVFKSPENFAVSGKGQMLFVPDVGIEVLPEDQSPEGRRIWFWNGQSGRFLERGATRTTTPAGPNLSSVEITPQCFLSSSGQDLYWFANEFKKLARGDGGVDLSVSNTFRAWRTDLTGMRQAQFAAFSFTPCKCETGVCSESCLEAGIWLPAEGLSDFFIVTHRIPGQISTTYDSSFLYRRSGDTWQPIKLPGPMERVLDAARGGAIIVHAVEDGGCCGWENEGSDQTLLYRDGKDIILYDEFKRYANQDYDVSFFASSAALSPDASFLAMTISSTAAPGSEIRLSDSGKPDAGELTRVRQTIKELPAVEVFRLEDTPRRIAAMPQATLAGWLSEKEILLVEGQVLVAHDIVTGAGRRSGIEVAKGSRVFVR